MLNVFSLDTSSDHCSVAMSLDGVGSSEVAFAPRKHAQLILPMIKTSLEKQKASLKDFNVIAFGCGPGSFTGLRIAAGIAQGLAYGSDLGVLPISNLRALALKAHYETHASRVLVAIDARMDEVYWGIFEVSIVDELPLVTAINGEHVSAPENVALDIQALCPVDSGDLVGVGSGMAFFERFPADLIQSISSYDVDIRPDAREICALAVADLSRDVVAGEPQDAIPSYIRDKVTWKKLPGRE